MYNNIVLWIFKKADAGTAAQPRPKAQPCKIAYKRLKYITLYNTRLLYKKGIQGKI